MFATGMTMGLAEWIIDDNLSCLNYIGNEKNNRVLCIK